MEETLLKSLSRRGTRQAIRRHTPPVPRDWGQRQARWAAPMMEKKGRQRRRPKALRKHGLRRPRSSGASCEKISGAAARTCPVAMRP